MAEQDIIITVENKVQIIKFNRPAKKNALTRNMYLKTVEALKKSATDDNIRITVLTGEGNTFSAGHDFKKSMMDEVVDDKPFDLLKNFADAIIDYPKLLIAVVPGPAVGIACTVLALCDIIYCSDNTYFWTPFSRLGLTAEGCSSYTFPKILGKSKASEMLYLNHKLTADEALRRGFVAEVLTEQQIKKDIWNRINDYAKLAPGSIQQSKRLVTMHEKELLHKINEEEADTLHAKYLSEETMSCLQEVFFGSKL